MNSKDESIRKRLKEAGLSDPLIDAAWPSWWSEDAFHSDSAKAELRFSIARKLGISPKSFLHDDVEFIWKDDARFKHLNNETEEEKFALTSFGISVSRMLLRCIEPVPAQQLRAIDLRHMILKNRPFIDLQSLLGTCWAMGIPVIHLRVFPLVAKRMHAMAVNVKGRYAILLGRDSQYPAFVTFTLAHELGHILLGHIQSSQAIVEVGDIFEKNSGDREEQEADDFALELLMGTSRPEISTNLERFNSLQLAQAVLQQGPAQLVEPGTLALCLAYQKDIWPIATNAMKYIYSQPKAAWNEVNQVAENLLGLGLRCDDAADYLRKIMDVGNDN